MINNTVSSMFTDQAFERMLILLRTSILTIIMMLQLAMINFGNVVHWVLLALIVAQLSLFMIVLFKVNAYKAVPAPNDLIEYWKGLLVHYDLENEKACTDFKNYLTREQANCYHYNFEINEVKRKHMRSITIIQFWFVIVYIIAICI